MLFFKKKYDLKNERFYSRCNFEPFQRHFLDRITAFQRFLRKMEGWKYSGVSRASCYFIFKEKSKEILKKPDTKFNLEFLLQLLIKTNIELWKNSKNDLFLLVSIFEGIIFKAVEIYKS